ncbi:hypothetical protein HPB48_010866 [Haemaphysalis longicornis]|uniref:Peptidase M13 N-terminal domain-containing protein n=1 Tax=Haemaphysalis longicornis TaxID=44386 RepID=A0A9J6FMY1_HAELO|nr:hypothetical protein HPB48_010866 [Haemaphysalis longicornis]
MSEPSGKPAVEVKTLGALSPGSRSHGTRKRPKKQHHHGHDTRKRPSHHELSAQREQPSQVSPQSHSLGSTPARSSSLMPSPEDTRPHPSSEQSPVPKSPTPNKSLTGMPSIPVKGLPLTSHVRNKSPGSQSPTKLAPKSSIPRRPPSPGFETPRKSPAMSAHSASPSVERKKSAWQSTRMSPSTLKDMDLLLQERTSNPSTVSKGRPISVCAGLTVTIGILAIFVIWLTIPNLSGQRNYDVLCRSEDCTKHLHRLQRGIDPSTSPCTNFSQYVCGRWKHDLRFQLSKSVLSDMLNVWLSDLEALLRRGAAEFPVASKALAMLESCMTQEGPTTEVVKKFMEDHGLSWPGEPLVSERPLAIMLDLSFNWDVPLWFRMKILPFVEDQLRRRIFFGANKLFRHWNLVFKQQSSFQAYRLYWQQFFRLFAGHSRYPEDEVIQKSFDVQNRVFQTLLAVADGRNETPLSFAVKDFYAVTNITGARTFKNLFNRKITIAPKLRDDDLLFFTNERLLGAVNHLLNNWNITDIVGHLSWLFVQQHGGMAYPRNALVTIFGDAQTAKQELPRYCAREVEASYKLLVAVLATLTRFSAAQRRGVEELLAAIQKVAATMTSDAGWLDNNTKAIAVEKLERVRTTLWPGEAFTSAEELRRVYASFPENASSFADFWIESRRNQRELFGSPEGYETQKLARSYAQPYLSYMHVANLVPISIGALSAPAYYPNGTKAMLYGGFGYWYAKNLLHAVDEGGVKVDPRRRVVTSWVANVTQEAFGARVLRCLGDGRQHFSRRFQHSNAGASGDAVVSRNFTEEQIFFLTACHMSCASSAEDNLYGGDCNKAVRNFKPFAEAFDCPEGVTDEPCQKVHFFH